MPAQRRSMQREKIYQAVRGTNLHPTADMVYAWLREELPRLSLGTVYRNLQQMAEEGRLRRLDGAPVRFDADILPHSHLRCTACGRVLDLPEVRYDEALDRAAEETGCRVERHELLFFGICSTCAGETTCETSA